MKFASLRSFIRNLPLVRQMMQSKLALVKTREELADLRELLAWEIADRRKNEARAASGGRSLHPHEHSVYSQNGEDGVLAEIFRRIGVGNRTFAEIGVGDGWQNNTLFLLCQGWRGAWLDADAACLKSLEAWPPETAARVRPVIASLNRENVAGIFRDAGIPVDLDLLSIDVDQNTFYLWEALHAWKPRVALIEYNGVIPPAFDWKVTYAADKIWDGSVNYGASLKALELLGTRLGYRLVHCELNGVNAFFVREDLVADRFEAPFTAEHHFEPLRFQHPDNVKMNRRALLDGAPGA